jgi:hypothetical protein
MTNGKATKIPESDEPVWPLVAAVLVSVTELPDTQDRRAPEICVQTNPKSVS